MGSRIIQVFYGSDCLPYKDVSRTTHFPITGNTFVNSSNVNAFHFYTRDIGGVNALSWVANVKLPNGKILYQLLPTYHLDEELNEYYVVFDLSSYYTQLKGDIYISLNGCQGEVEIEHDDESNLDEISGYIDSRTIVVTGAVKFSINYAPHKPSGYSFDLDQYETIVDALSNKANIINTVQVVADITLEDLSGYDNGQLFYSLASKTYYKKKDTSPYYEIAEENGLLGGNHALLRYKVVSTDIVATLPNLNNGTSYILALTSDNTNYKDYLVQTKLNSNIDVPAYDICAIDIVNFQLYYKSGVGSLTTLGDFFDSDNIIKFVEQTEYDNVLYGTDDAGNQTIIDYALLGANTIPIKTSAGQLGVPLTPTANWHATSKNYVDAIDSALRSLINTIKKNAYTLVDTTTYPTLNDFLASTGEEGYIYLYPSTNADEGYYQYIWEQSVAGHWLNLGTTQIDLSDYYTKTQTNALLDNKVTKTTNPSKLYGTSSGTATQTTYNVGYSVGSLMVVQRDGSSQIYVPTTPTGNNHATSKKYVDDLNAILEGLKVSKTSYAEKVYGTDELGEQTTYSVDSDLVGDGAVVRRESGTGTIVTGTPTSNTHATTKAYVDTKVANAISNVYKIKGSKSVAELNALTGQSVGDVYNLTDSGTLNAGNIQVFTGDNVVWLGSAWDKLGTEIDWTAYDEKFIAAGFFEVQPYNESTGEITFVYSTELYIMSYDSDTGVMTIQAN